MRRGPWRQQDEPLVVRRFNSMGDRRGGGLGRPSLAELEPLEPRRAETLNANFGGPAPYSRHRTGRDAASTRTRPPDQTDVPAGSGGVVRRFRKHANKGYLANEQN